MNGRVSPSSGLTSENVQQITQAFKVLPKYKEYLTNSDDGKVKWMGNLEELKRFVFDIFGEDGKWSSPGGSAKAFHNKKITITWYANKKTMLFQGQMGNMLKTHILKLNATESMVLDNDCNVEAEEIQSLSSQPLRAQQGTSIECLECRRLSVEMAEAKLDIEILRVTLNRFHESLTKLEGAIIPTKTVVLKQDVGTQTPQALEPISPTCPEVDTSFSKSVFSTRETNIHSSKSFVDQRQDEREKQQEKIYSSLYPQIDTLRCQNPTSDEVPEGNQLYPLTAMYCHKDKCYTPLKQQASQLKEQMCDYVEKHNGLHSMHKTTPSSVIPNNSVMNIVGITSPTIDDLKERSQGPPWDHSIVNKATHRVNQFKEQMRDYVKKHNSLHPMHNTTPSPIILNNSVSVVEIISPTFDDPKDLGQETWGQSNGNKVTHQRRQHQQQFRRQPLNNTSERVFNRSNKGKYQQRRQQQQHRRLPNRANPNINSQEFFRSAPTRNKEAHQKRSKSVPRFRLRELTTNNRTVSWLSYLELVRSITRQ